uniref:Elongation of very long chain fatty acids protein n=2 Tax=Cacopsylla melanoneura TaxID=428564 RepID=A0A8D8Z7K4_9HEMI
MDILLPDWLTSRIQIVRDEIVEDPVVDNWFLVQSWFPVTSIVVAYLVFVKVVGPRMMKNRQPYEIKHIILVYNLIQTLYNAYMASYILYPGVLDTVINNSCTPVVRSPEAPLWDVFCKCSYMYYISKLIDLCDTVFFVLRKKQSHVTFLHVYHHSMMVMTTWAFVRYFKGEQATFVGFLNCIVHVVMYSYYFLAALGPSVQKYLWWKKYLTKFQLVQFVLFGVHAVGLLLFRCPMPIAITYYMLLQAMVMCVLFGNFYYHTYSKRSSKKSTKAMN